MRIPLMLLTGLFATDGTRAIPALDAAQPKEVRTATFALG